MHRIIYFVILFLLLSSCSVHKTLNEKYFYPIKQDSIAIDFKINKVIKIGKDHRLDLTFYNNSKTDKYIVPKALVSIKAIPEKFEVLTYQTSSYIINDTLDLENIVQLKSGEVYNVNYWFIAEGDFFSPAVNKRVVFRYYNPVKNVEDVALVSGYFESDTLEISIDY